MTAILPNPRYTIAPSGTRKNAPSLGGVSLGAAALPTDPLFYTTLELQNVVVGSRYRVTRASDGTELATGVAADTTVTLSSIPVYTNPMSVAINVRKASSDPYYKPFLTFASLVRTGASAYILQSVD